MRKLFVLLGLGLLVLASGCETLNIGGGVGPERFSITGITLTPAEPAGGYLAGTDVTATIAFQGVTPPFTFTLAFPAGGATPATQTVVGAGGTATATFNITPFLLIDDADGKDIAFRVDGSDGAGSDGFIEGDFHVVGIPNQPVDLVSAVATGMDVVVTVADADNDDVTITFTAPAGISGAPATATVTGGNGTANFSFSGIDVFAGGTADITFTADDGASTDTGTATVTAAAFPLDADTLYAIPLSTSVAAGGRVTVVVATGDPANPFQYLTGTRVTIDQGADALYVGGTGAAGGTGDVPGSFNVGLPGGQAGEVDGYWTNMNPTGFLLAPDNFIQRSDAGGGLHGIDFNVTPLGGSDVAAGEGALFNFVLQMTNAGTYSLGFQDVNVVSRTYYQDGNQAPDYFWADITNAAAPSITVN